MALITDAFGGHGGIALYNRDFLTALCGYSDCEEVVALPRLMPNKPEPLPPKLTWHTEGLGGKSSYVKTLMGLLASDRRFDLIVCGHLNLLPLACLVKKLIGAPLLVELYGIEAWENSRGWLVKKLVRQVDVFTSISTITRDRFVSWSGVDISKVSLQPNAIHLEWYAPGSKDPQLLDQYGLQGKKVLMTLGRMSARERYKGFDEILDVLPELSKQIPEIAYLVVGDGDDRGRLEEKAKVLGISDRVVFTGFVPEVMKPEYYRLADLYVMPSYGEGFGFVFLEALACGIPCIGSKVDGGRDALQDGVLGCLVDPGDKRELRSAIQQFLSIGDRAVPAGLSFFSFENFSSRLINVVELVL